MVQQLHELGCERVFLLADHGFIFGRDVDVLGDPKPAGHLHRRYCFSPSKFTNQEGAAHPDWIIRHIPELGFTNDSSDALSSVIIPRSYGFFKKSPKGDLMFVHGGLTYQECDLLHLVSDCKYKPIVKIGALTVVNTSTGHDSQGREAYHLQEMDDNRVVEFEVTTTAEVPGEKPNPVKCRVTCSNANVKLKPDTTFTLKQGAKKPVRLWFNKEEDITELILKVVDENNKTLYKRTLRLLAPSIYGTGDLF